eukprot:TRINITY_DN17314_c0_g1_i1.p2 TRINITY_DN17314_c0_g1~~TRINITY_DN17314_c0_g1_i1.p2  ORF type:complete len:530 (-),score=100.60 TRINITY_DN17314_c0_g1_i1:338-1927(-)
MLAAEIATPQLPSVSLEQIHSDSTAKIDVAPLSSSLSDTAASGSQLQSSTITSHGLAADGEIDESKERQSDAAFRQMAFLRWLWHKISSGMEKHLRVPEDSAPWDHRTKMLATLSYCAAFACLGMILASLGPVYLELSDRTNIGLSSFGWLFTARSLGYLAGSAAGGPLFDMYAGNVLLAMSLLCTAIGNVLIPIARNIYLLLLGVSCQGVAMGFLDTGGNVLLMRVHEGQSGPYMQAMHLCFGLGSLVSPLFIRAAMGSMDGAFDWAFYGISIFIFIVSIFLMYSPSPALPKAQNTEPHPSDNKLLGLTRPILILCIHCGALLFVYVGLEVGYGAFLLAYSVESVGVTEAEGQYLTSLYWGSLSLGRLIAIPIATRYSPRQMLAVDFAGCFTAGVIIWTLHEYETALWVGSLIFGTSMGSIFPATISLGESYVAVSGRIASFFVMGAAFGETFVPMLLGQMLSRVSYYCFPAYATIIPVMMSLIFTSLVRSAKSIPGSRHIPLNDVEMSSTVAANTDATNEDMHTVQI